MLDELMNKIDAQVDEMNEYLEKSKKPKSERVHPTKSKHSPEFIAARKAAKKERTRLTTASKKTAEDKNARDIDPNKGSSSPKPTLVLPEETAEIKALKTKAHSNPESLDIKERRALSEHNAAVGGAHDDHITALNEAKPGRKLTGQDLKDHNDSISSAIEEKVRYMSEPGTSEKAIKQQVARESTQHRADSAQNILDVQRTRQDRDTSHAAQMKEAAGKKKKPGGTSTTGTVLTREQEDKAIASEKKRTDMGKLLDDNAKLRGAQTRRTNKQEIAGLQEARNINAQSKLKETSPHRDVSHTQAGKVTTNDVTKEKAADYLKDIQESKGRLGIPPTPGEQAARDKKQQQVNQQEKDTKAAKQASEKAAYDKDIQSLSPDQISAEFSTNLKDKYGTDLNLKRAEDIMTHHRKSMTSDHWDAALSHPNQNVASAAIRFHPNMSHEQLSHIAYNHRQVFVREAAKDKIVDNQKQAKAFADKVEKSLAEVNEIAKSLRPQTKEEKQQKADAMKNKKKIEQNLDGQNKTVSKITDILKQIKKSDVGEKVSDKLNDFASKKMKEIKENKMKPLDASKLREVKKGDDKPKKAKMLSREEAEAHGLPSTPPLSNNKSKIADTLASIKSRAEQNKAKATVYSNQSILAGMGKQPHEWEQKPESKPVDKRGFKVVKSELIKALLEKGFRQSALDLQNWNEKDTIAKSLESEMLEKARTTDMYDPAVKPFSFAETAPKVDANVKDVPKKKEASGTVNDKGHFIPSKK